ncbi:transcription factor bHLH148 [Lactuca sativa]|uniref:transcription factor bHLH148 n=1 Tax=Lactuca sativa TaxID=4236 RepID=UPI000CABBDB5|nr:transcription factor bHLH148 [Lactuca sativa]
MAATNPVTNNTDAPRDASKRRKKKKMLKQFSSIRNQVPENMNNDHDEITSWKSEDRQEAYSSKLFEALRHLRLSSGTSSHSVSLRGRAVREAADRVLAMAAKGRSRWSRAILSNKLKHKFMKSNLRQRGAIATATGKSRFKKPRMGILRLKSMNLPAVKRKTRDLGRLVPGCRKQPFPIVLEEVADYIAALEMQVKAMAALASIFSAGSSSGPGFATGAVNRNQLSLSRPPPSS